MSPIKKAGATKKNQLQLKKGKKVVQVKQEEENDNEEIDDSDEEEDDQVSDNAEDKELDLDIKNEDDSDEDDDDEEDDEEKDDDENDEEEDEEKDDDENDEEDEEEKDDDESDEDEGSPKKKQVKVEKKEQASKNLEEHTKDSLRERDARSLYIGKLPDGVTEQDLKDLSEDIVEVYLSQKMHSSNRFAFIRFVDETTAESNFTILQTKTIKDQPLAIDYCGSKRHNKDVGKEDRNARRLYVGNLPEDVTELDLKSLSEDIVEIYISQGPKKFAFLTFDSKEKAESNYEILKGQKIRGQQIFVDHKFKSANGVKQISVSGLPLDVTIEQVAPFFKKAFQITLNRSNSSRTASISFDTEEDAKEANDAAKDVTIAEHKLTSVLCENTEYWSERGGPFGGRGQIRGGRGQFRGGRGQFRGGRGQFRGGRGQFRGDGNNFGKRIHDGGNFRGGRGSQSFAKRMRY